MIKYNRLRTLAIVLLVSCLLFLCLLFGVEGRDSKGYYKILGVSEKASHQEIKKAYRKLSLVYHPDKSRNKPQAEQQTLQQQYMKILEAYETLSDEQKRKEYDMGGFNPYHGYHQQSSEDQHHGSSFHFSFEGGGADADPFEDFPQFFKHFQSQGEGRSPFFSFFGDDDEDDSPPFGFHFESNSGNSNSRKRKSEKRASSGRRTSQPPTKKEEEGGFLSSLFGVVGDFYNSFISSEDDDQSEEEFQTVKKIITQINADGSRTTRVVYEKVPIHNRRRTVFRF